MDLQAFGTFFDKSGLPLSDQQKATLFQAWPMLRAMIDRVTAPMPREIEPSVVFQPEQK
jgi:hypothetical protein